MKRFAVHHFTSKDDLGFDPDEYSRLKHGSGEVAKKYGEELAKALFEKHFDLLVKHHVVIMESAYAFVPNAASMITDHFTSTLNRLMAKVNGRCAMRMKINRMVPYIADYGTLSMKKRQKLLSQDNFTFDVQFARGKFLLFIDDIYITGAHHRKIEEMLGEYNINSERAMGLYYAELVDSLEDPAIEAYLNHHSVNSLKTLNWLMNSDKDYRVIVRTLKMILSEQNLTKVSDFIDGLSNKMLFEIYDKCLGEGYHKNPVFSGSFAMIRNRVIQLS